MDKKYKSKKGLVYLNQYHVIFCPKYRRKVLVGAIEKDLKEADEAIGRPEDVRDFVRETLENIIGIEVQKTDKGLIFVTSNLPEPLKGILPEGDTVKVRFKKTYFGNEPRVKEIIP